MEPRTRSRNGCTSCRSRRRKCDEQKPRCGLCVSSDRKCQYTRELTWGGHAFGKSRFGRCLNETPGVAAHRIYTDNKDFVYGTSTQLSSTNHFTSSTPRTLSNGIEIPHIYRRLLDYFSNNILASISCHRYIHQELSRTLIPQMLHSPHLMSAGLALSAIGYSARGLTEIDGSDLSSVIQHLQTTSVSSLRTVLSEQQHDDSILSTSVMLCLAELYAGQGGSPPWRMHLKGAEAFFTNVKSPFSETQRPERKFVYLYCLYMSLGGLSNVQSTEYFDLPSPIQFAMSDSRLSSEAEIKDFLGFDTNVLVLLQEIIQLSRRKAENLPNFGMQADALRDKLERMISLNESAPATDDSHSVPPAGKISNNTRDCQQMYQHATVIYLYRHLYDLPSTSTVVRGAIDAIIDLIKNMVQGQNCNAWVVSLMPLFAAGCEASTEPQREFILDQLYKLEACIGSRHVANAREAVQQVWRIREERGDHHGRYFVLGDLGYNLVVF